MPRGVRPPPARGHARRKRGGSGGRRRAVAVTRSRGFTGKIARGKPHHSIPAHYVRWLPTATKRRGQSRTGGPTLGTAIRRAAGPHR